MRRVLVIAYYFPPIGGSGTQRPVKFVKCLPNLGWHPFVISTDEAYGGGAEGRDETLLTDIPRNVQVWRIPTPQPQPVNRLARWVGWRGGAMRAGSLDSAKAVPREVDPSTYSLTKRIRRAVLSPLYLIQNPLVDPALYWSLRIVPLARHIIQREQIDVLLTTVPPWSALLAGRLLQQFTGRPWVADFRDPWTDNTFIYFPTPTRHRLNKALESHFIDHADGVISVTEPCVAALRQKAAMWASNKPFVMIPNGWDQADFPDISAVQAGLPPPQTVDGRIVLLHPGSAYQSEPLPLLDALDRLAADGIDLQRLCFHFIGYVHPQDQVRIANSPHNMLFRLDGDRVPHDEVLRLMRSAHILLLLLRKGPYASSGKVFEYMVVGRPVLHIGATDGVAGQLVQRSAIGCTVNPNAVEELAITLRLVIHDYAGFVARYYRPNWDVICQYERRSITEELAKVLDDVLVTGKNRA